jgi:hypothetical protein
MKKQELIHLHGLLSEVGSYYEAKESETISLDEYEAKGVRPTSIHRSKTDHKEAVFALADGLTSEMVESADEEQRVAARAD